MKSQILPDLELIFVVEYSIQQDCVMVKTLEECLKNNRRNVRAGRSVDYIPVGVTQTREKADKIANKVRVEIEKKGKTVGNNWSLVGDILKKLFPAKIE